MNIKTANIGTGFLFLAMLVLAACGGGGGDGGAAPPTLQTVAFSRDVGGQFDLFLVREDGSGVMPLATSVGDEFFVGATGGRVIFSRTVGGTQDDLYSINADGTGLVPLATAADNESFESVF